MLRRLTRTATGVILDDILFNGLGLASRHLPAANPDRFGVTVEHDLHYRDSDKRYHRFDLYRPKDVDGPLPVVLYVHGGGFRKLSKDTHWVMGLIFAQAGYLVYNINYRLAPKYPYPAGLDDLATALEFVAQDAPQRGGDLDRLVFSGESAGANLVTALTIATCYKRPEPWARRAWESGLLPKATIPACGIFQVSNIERFGADPIPRVISNFMRGLPESYLGDIDAQPSEAKLLADPVVFFEQGQKPDRAPPSFFLPVGTYDPLIEDTRRLNTALEALGIETEARYYPRGMHAFHAFVLAGMARQCWRDQFEFLDRVWANHEVAVPARRRSS